MPLAIHAANPHLGKALARRYAREAQAVCRKHQCDPFTIVAMVEYESRWDARAVHRSGSEEYVGLGQIRLRNYAACRKGLAQAACVAKRKQLLTASYNLRAIGAHITAARKYCARATGRRALFARWLAVYQGVDAQRGSTCNQRKTKRGWKDLPLHPLTARVIQRRGEFVRGEF